MDASETSLTVPDVGQGAGAKKRWHERERCKKAGVPVPEWAKVQSSRKRPSSPPKPHVICGDARELIRSVPMDAYLISDPPYNQGYHYDVYADNMSAHEYAELIRSLFQGRPSVLVHYPEETINVLARALGPVSDVMAWVYPSNQAKQHRLATWWHCKPDWTKTPQDYKNPTDKRVAALIAQGKRARGYDWVEMNHVKNVSDIGHPCPIPYELAERLVLSTTKPGDLVCDPFAGSGTVLLAALRNGRRAMGFELSPKYTELANERLRGALQETKRL